MSIINGSRIISTSLDIRHICAANVVPRNLYWKLMDLVIQVKAWKCQFLVRKTGQEWGNGNTAWIDN